jgi:hypothetical protein
MNHIELTLVLLGAFWAGTSAVFTGIKSTGDLRDSIVLGKVGSNDLPPPYVRHLFWFEWVPLKLSLAAISFVLAVIILLLPTLEGGRGSEQFRTICSVAAALPFIGAIVQLGACLTDGRFMWRRMKAPKGIGR